MDGLGGCVRLPNKDFNLEAFDLSKVKVESVEVRKELELFNQLSKEFYSFRDYAVVKELDSKLQELINLWDKHKDSSKFPTGKTVIRDEFGNAIGSQG